MLEAVQMLCTQHDTPTYNKTFWKPCVISLLLVRVSQIVEEPSISWFSLYGRHEDKMTEKI